MLIQANEYNISLDVWLMNGFSICFSLNELESFKLKQVFKFYIR